MRCRSLGRKTSICHKVLGSENDLLQCLIERGRGSCDMLGGGGGGGAGSKLVNSTFGSNMLAHFSG